MNLEDKKRLVRLKRAQILLKARSGDFKSFVAHVKKDYVFNWHHSLIADTIQRFLKDPSRKKLAIFVPPQHGKSELTTRLAPAYAHGENPNLKIAICSYSSDLAKAFNRSVQRYIDSDEYMEIYPNTRLNSKNVVTVQSWLRNSEEYEIVNKKGSLKAVGVGGGLSGHPVDLAIIDDPIKDYKEAASEVVREAVWNWYVSVLSTRLHNDSKQILIMTRWHADDLAGRLLNSAYSEDEFYTPWEVLSLPAILEQLTEGDPRSVGEALWPNRHSLNKILSIKSQSENIFNSLYQQNPVKKGGNKVNTDKLIWVDSIPDHLYADMWIDGAYTKESKNDPTGIMEVYFDEFNSRLYISLCKSKHQELPELIREVKLTSGRARWSTIRGSKVFIEPKASGKSLKQMLDVDKERSVIALEIDSYLVQEGKDARLQLAAVYIEAGRIHVLRRPENDIMVEQLSGYPNVAHDEFVDLMGYACDYYFKPDLVGDRYTPIGLYNLL